VEGSIRNRQQVEGVAGERDLKTWECLDYFT